MSAYELHKEAGHFCTKRRQREFEKRVGVNLHNTNTDADRIAVLSEPEQAQKLNDELTAAGSTCCDLARRIFESAGVSQSLLERSKTLLAEMDLPYPAGADAMFADLTQQFNEIRDDEEINKLQKECVARVDDAGVGLALAQSVRETIQKVRAKDLLGARIIVLTQLYTALVARAEEAHAQKHSMPHNSLRRALVSLIQHFDGGGSAKHALRGALPEDVARLAAYFGLSDGATSEEIGEIASLYIQEAVRTRAVEDYMH